jgi:hypothetical protein
MKKEVFGKTFKPFHHGNVKDTKETLATRGMRVTHGDLIIVRCETSDVPANFASLKDVPGGVLAEGEHTNHAHQLFYEETPAFQVRNAAVEAMLGEEAQAEGTYELKMVSPQEMYLRVVGGPVLLKHQEHHPYRLYEGFYQVGFQQETDHFEKVKRQVQD